jgi:uncharacterized membrane protein
MDDLTIARLIHLFGVVLWIGGVSFVTTVLLPATRATRPAAEQMTLFQAVERRFAMQARLLTLLVGASGFYMIHLLDAWDRFGFAAYWWMHAMIGVWFIFTAMLFVAEPLFLDRWLAARAEAAPEATFRLMQRLHWVLLCLSIVTVLGAAAGAHGWLAFE